MSCCLYLLSLRRAVGVIVLLLRRYSNPITAQLIAEYIKKVESFWHYASAAKVEEKEKTPVTIELPARKQAECGGRLVGAGGDEVESLTGDWFQAWSCAVRLSGTKVNLVVSTFQCTLLSSRSKYRCLLSGVRLVLVPRCQCSARQQYLLHHQRGGPALPRSGAIARPR